jgi:hypothetical protein
MVNFPLEVAMREWTPDDRYLFGLLGSMFVNIFLRMWRILHKELGVETPSCDG